MSSVHAKLRYLPACIVLGVSWYLSSQHTVPMPDMPYSDKIVHAVCFAGLSFCFALWLRADTWIKRPLRGVCFAVLCTSAYGVIDELHQMFVPGRDASVFDWAADTAGAFCGALAFLLLFRLITRYGSRKY